MQESGNDADDLLAQAELSLAMMSVGYIFLAAMNVQLPSLHA